MQQLHTKIIVVTFDSKKTKDFCFTSITFCLEREPRVYSLASPDCFAMAGCHYLNWTSQTFVSLKAHLNVGLEIVEVLESVSSS